MNYGIRLLKTLCEEPDAGRIHVLSRSVQEMHRPAVGAAAFSALPALKHSFRHGIIARRKSG